MAARNLESSVSVHRCEIGGKRVTNNKTFLSSHTSFLATASAMLAQTAKANEPLRIDSTAVGQCSEKWRLKAGRGGGRSSQRFGDAKLLSLRRIGGRTFTLVTVFGFGCEKERGGA